MQIVLHIHIKITHALSKFKIQRIHLKQKKHLTQSEYPTLKVAPAFTISGPKLPHCNKARLELSVYSPAIIDSSTSIQVSKFQMAKGGLHGPISPVPLSTTHPLV